jgi:hypothetical protein
MNVLLSVTGWNLRKLLRFLCALVRTLGQGGLLTRIESIRRRLVNWIVNLWRSSTDNLLPLVE